MENGRFAFLSA